jgi:hypothetical protein
MTCPDHPHARGEKCSTVAAGPGGGGAGRPRDICEEERKKEDCYIIRQDYYIQCTCRYKGPALHGKCPKCGTDRLSLPFPALGR